MKKAKETVNRRFLRKLDELKANGKIRSAHDFCIEYGYDPGNLSRLKREPHRELPLSLLVALVSKYGVSGDWLLTGKAKHN